MGLDLNYKTYNPYGAGNVLGSDLLNSSKWRYAIYDKTPLTEQQTDQYFNYYENHPYLKNATYAVGQRFSFGSTLNKKTYEKNQGLGNFSTHTSEAKSYFAVNPNKNLIERDPFSHLRIDELRKGKTNWNVDGDRITFDYTTPKAGAAGTKIYRNPFTGEESSTPIAAGNKLAHVNQFVRTDYSDDELETKNFSGRLLNNAFVPDDVYEQMSDVERQFYGLTGSQATQLDPNFSQAKDVVQAAYDYRSFRASKKTGLSAYGPSAIALAGIATGNPLAAAGFGGISGAASSGGNFSSILSGALKGYAATAGLDFVKSQLPAGNATTPGFNPGANGTSNLLQFKTNPFTGLDRGLNFSNTGTQVFNSATANIPGTFNPNAVAGTSKVAGIDLGKYIGDLGNSLLGLGKDIFGGLSNIGILPTTASGGLDFGQILSRAIPAGLEYLGNKQATDKIAKAQERASRTADQGSAARTTAGRTLDELLRDPSNAENISGFSNAIEKGEQGVIRRNAAGGYSRSGNILNDIFNYNADFTYRNYADYATLLNNIVGGSPQVSAGFQSQRGFTQGQGIVDSYGALGRIFGGNPEVTNTSQVSSNALPGSTVFDPRTGQQRPVQGWDLEDIFGHNY